MRVIVMAVLLAGCGADPNEFVSEDRLAQFCEDVFCECLYPGSTTCTPDCVDGQYREFHQCSNWRLDAIEECLQPYLDAQLCDAAATNQCWADSPC